MRPATTKPSAEKPVRPIAGRSSVTIVFFLLLSVVFLCADLLSKHLVFQSFLDNPALPEQVHQLRLTRSDVTASEVLARQQRQIVPSMMRFTLSTNPNVVFSLPMPRWLVLATTMLTIVLVTFFFATSSASARLVHLARALILGGALGNFYDRLFSEVTVPGLEPIRYQVRDFIDCSQIGYHYIFNVADALLVVGVGLLIIQWLIDGRKIKAAKTSKSDQD